MKNYRKCWQWLMLSGVLACLPTTVLAGVAEGYDYLVNAQQPGGNWCEDEVAFVCTDEAIAALELSSRRGDAYFRGIAWLENHASANQDDLARQTRSLSGRPGGVTQARYAAITDRATETTAGRGWGLGTTLTPSPFDTAQVLQALATDPSAGNYADYVAYLKATRLAASGWEAVPDEGFDIVTTAYVVRTLDKLRSVDLELDVVIQEATTALAGAVGEGSSPMEKGLALAAVALETPASPLVSQWRTDLLSAQLADGSWSGSELSTALVLQALTMTSGNDVDDGSEVVFIPDANLRAAINDLLGRNRGDAITRGDLAGFTSLDLANLGISDLTGLEHAVNLVSLDISGNSVASLAPVAGLSSLQMLDVTGNPLSHGEDFDGDGFSDGAEQLLGLNPLDVDSDDDGIIDGDDPFPGFAGTPGDNSAPTAVEDSATTLNTDAVSILVLANDIDPDGDVISVVDIYSASHGAASMIDGGQSVRYLPSTAYHGTDQFSYRIHDGRGGFSKATVTVDVQRPNENPDATDDSVVVRSGRTITITPLNNDTDPDEDSLTVTSITTPVHGEATLQPDGVSITYTADRPYRGEDSIQYTVSDGYGGTASATVSIRIRNSSVIRVVPSFSN